MQYMVPFWLMSTMRSRSSSLKRSIGFNPSSRTPALLIRMSILPYFSMAVATSLSASPFLEMSVTTGNTSPPASRMAAATSSSGATRRAVIITFAPSFANNFAVAAPTPELPPVITATFPSNRFISNSSSYFTLTR